MGRTERGSPIAPADRLVGAIDELALTGQTRPLHLIHAGAFVLPRRSPAEGPVFGAESLAPIREGGRLTLPIVHIM